MSKKAYLITLTAVFAAVGIALNLLSSAMPRIDTFGRISLVYAFCFLAGALVGPWLGFSVAALADFLPAVLFPEGPYMPLITLSNAVMALISGLMFNHLKTNSVTVKLVFTAILSFIFCTLGLTALGETFLYNMGMQAYYPTTTMLVNAGLPVFLATVVRKSATQWFWITLNVVLSIVILKSPSVVRFFSSKIKKTKIS
jgi:ECF transporter S component (folate family)